MIMMQLYQYMFHCIGVMDWCRFYSTSNHFFLAILALELQEEWHCFRLMESNQTMNKLICATRVDGTMTETIGLSCHSTLTASHLSGCKTKPCMLQEKLLTDAMTRTMAEAMATSEAYNLQVNQCHQTQLSNLCMLSIVLCCSRSARTVFLTVSAWGHQERAYRGDWIWTRGPAEPVDRYIDT